MSHHLVSDISCRAQNLISVEEYFMSSSPPWAYNPIYAVSRPSSSSWTALVSTVQQYIPDVTSLLPLCHNLLSLMNPKNVDYIIYTWEWQLSAIREVLVSREGREVSMVWTIIGMTARAQVCVPLYTVITILGH